MPELADVERRVRDVELDFAGVKQRVSDHEEDIRRFAGLVVDAAEARKDRDALAKDVREAHDAVRRLETRFEASEKERVKVREAREEKERARERSDRRYRIATWLAAAGMFLTFVATSVGVVELVLKAG